MWVLDGAGPQMNHGKAEKAPTCKAQPQLTSKKWSPIFWHKLFCFLPDGKPREKHTTTRLSVTIVAPFVSVCTQIRPLSPRAPGYAQV